MQSTRDLKKIAEAFGGMPIWGCIPGSPCHRAGVIYGDIILSVNGQPTDSVNAYVEAKKLDDEDFRVRILRRGSQFEVVVPLDDKEDRIAELEPAILGDLRAQASSRFIDEESN